MEWREERVAVKAKYEKDIDLEDPNDTHARLIEMVGREKKVLDLGCSTGYVARVLSERGCSVTGIEVDVEAAREAEKHCRKVLVADLDGIDLARSLAGEAYDVCLFGDVVEHLKEPGRLLVGARGVLSEGGYVVLSVPNITHASIRLMMLEGRFEYEETGILDDTHLRFFTRRSITDLLEGCGFLVDVMDWTEQRVSEGELRSALDPLGIANLEKVIESFSSWESVAYQYVIKAFPAGDEALLRRLSEEKTDAQKRLKALEREVAELRKVKEYVKRVEESIEKKNEYIKMLEDALAERDRRILEMDRGLGEPADQAHNRGRGAPAPSGTPKRRRR